jgi:isoamylase
MPYSVTSWVDWNLADTPQGQSLTAYVARLVSLRHSFATLQSQRFLHGDEIAPGVQDTAWFDERGQALSA